MGNEVHIEVIDEGVVIDLKVVPGGSRDQIAGVLGDALKVKVSASPEGGKANKAVCGLLAKTFDLAKRDVVIYAGKTQPRKRVLLVGVEVEMVRRVIGGMG